MYLSRAARRGLQVVCALVLFVLYFPILYVARLSVNTARNYAWPPSGFTLEWWHRAVHEPGPRTALMHSIQTGLCHRVKMGKQAGIDVEVRDQDRP